MISLEADCMILSVFLISDKSTLITLIRQIAMKAKLLLKSMYLCSLR